MRLRGRKSIDPWRAIQPNAYGAHTHAQVCEAGDLASGWAFLRSWLVAYPRHGGFYGHLNWHLALFELQAGDAAAVFRLYSEAVAPEVNRDPALSILANAASFLWRWELAGQPHDSARWQAMLGSPNTVTPWAGNGYADWHTARVEAAAGDGQAAVMRSILPDQSLGRDHGCRRVPARVGTSAIRGGIPQE